VNTPRRRCLCFERLGDYYLLCQNQHTADDDEWNEWVRFVTQAGPSGARTMRVLVFSAGGSPSPKQRRQIHELMPVTGNGVPTAVVIGSRIWRAVVGTMSLFNKHVRAFSPQRVGDALRYLEIPAEQHPDVFALARKLHQRLELAFECAL